MTDKVIRFGLDAVHDVSEDVADSIVAGAPYSSFGDFLTRNPAVGLQAATSLIAAGALDSLGISRAVLTEALPAALGVTATGRKLAALGQRHYLVGFHVSVDGPEWSLVDLLAREAAALGCYVSGHPVDAYDLLGCPGPGEVRGCEDGTGVTVAGLVIALTHKISKRGQPWAVMTIEDAHGVAEVLWFPSAYGELDGFEVGAVIAVAGRVRDGQLVGQEIRNLALAGPVPMFVHADAETLDISAVRAQLLTERNGRPVHLVLTHHDRSITIQLS
jgi:DNA polymerase-3 subunit alpha